MFYAVSSLFQTWQKHSPQCHVDMFCLFISCNSSNRTYYTFVTVNFLSQNILLVLIEFPVSVCINTEKYISQIPKC